MAEYRHYRSSFESFDGVALYREGSGNLTGDGDPERVGVAATTPNLFEVLEVAPSLGRVYTVDESRNDMPDVVVLSHQLWERRYGAIERGLLLQGLATGEQQDAKR